MVVLKSTAVYVLLASLSVTPVFSFPSGQDGSDISVDGTNDVENFDMEPSSSITDDALSDTTSSSSSSTSGSSLFYVWSTSSSSSSSTSVTSTSTSTIESSTASTSSSSSTLSSPSSISSLVSSLTSFETSSSAFSSQTSSIDAAKFEAESLQFSVSDDYSSTEILTSAASSVVSLMEASTSSASSDTSTTEASTVSFTSSYDTLSRGSLASSASVDSSLTEATTSSSAEVTSSSTEPQTTEEESSMFTFATSTLASSVSTASTMVPTPSSSLSLTSLAATSTTVPSHSGTSSLETSSLEQGSEEEDLKQENAEEETASSSSPSVSEFPSSVHDNSTKQNGKQSVIDIDKLKLFYSSSFGIPKEAGNLIAALDPTSLSTKGSNNLSMLDDAALLSLPGLRANSQNLSSDYYNYKLRRREVRISDFYETEMRKFPVLPEIDAFGKVLGAQNLNCKFGCTNIPSPEGIAQHVQEAYPLLSDEEREEQIRWRWFAMIDVQILANDFKKTYDSYIRLQTNLGQKAFDLLRLMIPRENFDAQKACNMKVKIITSAVSFYYQLLGALAFKAGDEAAGPVGVGIAFQSFIVQQTLEHLLKNNKDFNEYFTKAISTNSTEFVAYMPLSENKVCAALGHPGAPGNGASGHDEYVLQLSMVNEWIQKTFQMLRAIEEGAATIVFNKSDRDESIILKRLRDVDDNKPRNISDPERDEPIITKQWVEYLAGTLQTKLHRCWVMYVDMKGDMNKRNELCADKSPRAGSRLCLEEGTGVLQGQCLTLQREGSHLVPIGSSEAFRKLGLSAKKIIANSWRQYSGKDVPVPLLVNNDSEPDTNHTMLELEQIASFPVCNSDLLRLTDFSGKEDGSNNPKRDQQFPIGCGGFLSQETAAVYREMGIGLGSISRRRGDMEDILEIVMYEQLWNLSPIRNYIEWCGVGGSHPMIDSAPPIIPKRKSHYYRDPDSRCDAIREKVRGMTEHEANVWFCSATDPLARQIISGEKEYSGWHPIWKKDRYQSRCERHMKGK
ncbi:hypothetical protein GLAREA_07891 [Glarea lozoyensis ATCC 20868]|uniref:Uncharacterized protein n=1 Tax=Glarea lozoyensis (strain ATCC 20868 / MF5171) TaxID=1116229 RepID=S3D2M0_GLAL2|nr:uncharacterized protein GLAREA_07891 [Glarea lozoyensis ATCC 20868]EPE32757.1 hypothetical protein GLAREA_07891 [Glarea lozoyensis ATCC 20868]